MEFKIVKPMMNAYPEDEVEFIFNGECVEIKIKDALPKEVKISYDDFREITHLFQWAP